MYSQIIKEGYPSGAFYGPKCSGIDSDGNYIINRDEDGKPINEYLGSAQPKFNLGFGMNLTYRDFDFSFAGYGMFGQKVLNATRMAMFDPTRLPAQNVPDDFLESGIKSDPVFSSYFVENGSFFRLQSVTLGYTLPGVKKIGLERLRASVTLQNMVTFTGYSGLDPEFADSGIFTMGADYCSFPNPRAVQFALSFTF